MYAIRPTCTPSFLLTLAPDVWVSSACFRSPPLAFLLAAMMRNLSRTYVPVRLVDCACDVFDSALPAHCRVGHPLACSDDRGEVSLGSA